MLCYEQKTLLDRVSIIAVIDIYREQVRTHQFTHFLQETLLYEHETLAWAPAMNVFEKYTVHDTYYHTYPIMQNPRR